MAGCSGYILAVGLLGCTRTCQIAQHGSMARLSGTYRTAGTYRGQAGTLWCTKRQSGGGAWSLAAQRPVTGEPSRPPGRLSAARTGAAPWSASPPDPRISRSVRRPRRRTLRAGGTRAVRKLLDFSGPCQPSQPMGWLDLMESSSLSELFPRWGFWVRMRGYQEPRVPNVGITGTVGNSPVILLLGHRSTGHTTHTGPMIRLSPADQMVCAATRPFSARERGDPGGSPGPRKARPGG